VKAGPTLGVVVFWPLLKDKKGYRGIMVLPRNRKKFGVIIAHPKDKRKFGVIITLEDKEKF